MSTRNNFLEALNYSSDFQNVLELFQVTFENFSNIWNNISKEIKLGNSPYPNFEAQNILEYIRIKSDLDFSEENNPLSKPYVSLQKKEYDYWNPSVKQLVQDITNLFLTLPQDYANLEKNDSTEKGPFLWESKDEYTYRFSNGSEDKNIGTNVTLKDLMTADAGNTFEENSNLGIEGTPWATPKVNTINKHYYEQRNEQASSAKMVLTNENNLQFTQELITLWLRLIMPKYDRRVEVEDLDRDFWSIAQCIGALTDYLFGNDSPLKQIFSDMLSELAELWENLLYLWIAFSILKAKHSRDVRTEFIQIPIMYEYTGIDTIREMDRTNKRKLDFYAFGEYNQIEDLEKIFSYLKHKYTESSLVLVPYYRKQNYYKDYFSGYNVPCLVYYNRARDEWKKINFEIDGEINSINIYANDDIVKSNLNMFRDLGNGIQYIFPATSHTENADCTDSNLKRFYTAIELCPYLNVKWGEESEHEKEGKLYLTDFSISARDAVAEYLEKVYYQIDFTLPIDPTDPGQKRKLAFCLDDVDTIKLTKTDRYLETYEDKSLPNKSGYPIRKTRVVSKENEPKAMTQFAEKTGFKEKSFYMGECITHPYDYKME